MRKQASNMTPLLCCSLILAMVSGCQERRPDDAFENFRFVPPEGSSQCDDECEPSVVNMCDISINADVLLFGRIVSSNYVLEPCEDRVYRRGHFSQTVEVLEVAAGTYADPEVNIVAISPSRGIAEDVGDEAILGIRKVDGVWVRQGAAEIEITSGTASPADEPGQPDIIYDLPTRVSDFKQEAQSLWSDFQTQCGREREFKSDSELHAFLTDKDCPTGDPFPEEYEDPD